MRILLSISIFLFFLKDNNAPLTVMVQPPEYYVLEWKEGTQLTQVKTDFYIEIDSMGRQDVLALLNKRNVPELYTAEISTPVCADGECKLMNIKFYWTQLGEYAGFDRYPMMPLTKHDHDEFEEKDYQKLHKLLEDDKNLMGRRKMEQLVEKPKMRTVNGVDAVSGATIARVKESVVSGALYSCYTAWHLVHGDIQDKLKAHTLSILDKQMTLDMLYSINPEYQIFSMENMEADDYKNHYEQLGKVFRTSTPLVRSIIIKRLTANFNNTPDLQKPFWNAFDEVDISSRSLMIKYLGEAPDYVSEVLSKKLGSMSKNQLKGFLNYLSSNDEVNSEVKDKLKKFSQSDEIYAYLVHEFISETQ